MTEDSIRVTAGRPTGGTGSASTDAVRRKGPDLPVPSEAIVLAAFTAAVLIAAAVADNFDATPAWAFVTLLGFAYIISRGLAKRHGHDGF